MEEEAALCYRPLLLLNRHSSVTIQNCKIEYDKCKETESVKSVCLNRYKSTMEKVVSERIDKLYKGYLRNYDPDTGRVLRAGEDPFQ